MKNDKNVGKKRKLNGKIGNLLTKIPDKNGGEMRGKYEKMWVKTSKNAAKTIVSQLKHRWKC